MTSRSLTSRLSVQQLTQTENDPLVTDGLSSQRVSNVEKVSMLQNMVYVILWSLWSKWLLMMKWRLFGTRTSVTFSLM